MNLSAFMNGGISNIAQTAVRFYLHNSRGRAFMLRMSSSFDKNAQIREQYEKEGVHIPPFLIASIASNCNLRCAGCYARANGNCGNDETSKQLGTNDWRRIFKEASDIGVSFILLAGGEPLLRREIIQTAAEFKNIAFPVFTNGTMINSEYLNLFDGNRNLVPVVSIEGNDDQTDARRGPGISGQVWEAADRLKEKGILFGVSITVTTENKDSVVKRDFVDALRDRGCGLIFYVEYVPAEENTEHLVLTYTDVYELQSRIDCLRGDKRNKRLIMLSFPGDEQAIGGCLAAGRGFFHINSCGGAEPCPFSPFSGINLKEQSLISVLQSDFFAEVRKISSAEALNRKGGCTLFQHKDEVREIAME